MTGIASVNTMLYCPKCQKTFEESSRRFCDNDGGRLLPAPNAPESPNKNGGVFTNLIGKSPSKQSQDEKLAAIPRFSRSDFAPIEKTPKPYDDEPEIELELFPRTKRTPIIAPPVIEKTFQPPRSPVSAPPPIRETVSMPLPPGEESVAVPPPPVMRENLSVPPELESIFTPPPLPGTKPVAKPVLPLPRVIKQSEVHSGTAEIGNRRTNPTGRLALTINNPNVLLGQTIKGRYYIVEILSQDESGIEYLSEDKLSPPKKHLVKVLTGQVVKDDLLENIYAEERISLSHISHPNIARVVDSGELHEGFRFLVTEFDEGDSVADLLESAGQFNAMRTARIIRQASYALSEVHESGILHRNLKSSNLLLNVNEAGVEQVRINGFGASDSQSNERNAVYQAPEVIEGKLTTFASDIYSLAAIAYQMLTNQPPFEGGSTREILRAKQEDLRVYPSSLRQDLSPSVDGILEKAMSYSPTARYAKTRDFGDAFFNAVSTAAEWNDAMTEEVGKTAGTILTEEVPPTQTVFADEKVLAEIPAFDADKVESANQKIYDAPVVPDISFKPQIIEPQTQSEISTVNQKIGKDANNDDPAWARRSPEPPKTVSLTTMLLSLIGIAVLLVSAWAIWKYAAAHQSVIDAENQQINQAQEAQPEPSAEPTPLISAPLKLDIEVPPNARQIEQPPNTVYFQNTKQSVKGDLVRNFLGFSLYYPKDWKSNEVKPSEKAGTRGKFLDLSKNTPDGNLAEQMLVSYYDSKGTFKDDAPKFPQLVKETNDTLKKLIPNYQVLGEGETEVNGWKAYEVKFQGGGTNGKGAKMILWGRRLFIPQVRAGAYSGYEITMLATSEAANVKSVDDIGNKDELADILETFEPNQSY